MQYLNAKIFLRAEERWWWWQGRGWPGWRTTQIHNNNSICQNWCRHQSVPLSHCAGSILPTFPPTIITSPADCTNVTHHFRSRDSDIMALIVPRLQTPEFMEFNRNDQTEHEMCFYTIIYWRGPGRYFVLGVVRGLFVVLELWWEPGRQHQTDWWPEIDLMVFSAQCRDNCRR